MTDLGPFGDHRTLVEEVELIVEGSRHSAFPAGEEVARLERVSDRAVRALPRYVLHRFVGSYSGGTQLHYDAFARSAQMEHDRRLTERHIAALQKLEDAANYLAKVGIVIAAVVGVIELAQLIAQIAG